MIAEREARAGLSGATPPGSRHWADVVREQGAVLAWERALREGRGRPGDAARHLLAARRLGARLLVPGDPQWPAAVDRFASASYYRSVGSPELLPPAQQLREPIGLWVRGPLDLAVVSSRAVAVVGSRAATRYGEDVTLALAGELASRGWTVVSGGATGIDAAAHRGALAADAPTVAVLAGGVDVLYPRGNDVLLRRVLTSGALVSEVPPGYAPMRERFLTRNRVIVGLARGVVLVEAGWRSGALNTTAHARAVERPVCAVPGPITSARSTGCHREVRERGAVLVTCADDVVSAIGFVGEQLPERQQEPLGPRDGLRAGLARLLEAVPARAPASTESIARVAGLDATFASRALGELAVAGLVERAEGRWRLTALGRAPAAASRPTGMERGGSRTGPGAPG